MINDVIKQARLDVANFRSPRSEEIQTATNPYLMSRYSPINEVGEIFQRNRASLDDLLQRQEEVKNNLSRVELQLLDIKNKKTSLNDKIKVMYEKMFKISEKIGKLFNKLNSLDDPDEILNIEEEIASKRVEKEKINGEIETSEDLLEDYDQLENDRTLYLKMQISRSEFLREEIAKLCRNSPAPRRQLLTPINF